MSVNKSDRNVADTPQNRHLDAAWKARGLSLHTMKICKNKSVFLPEYQSALTDDIIRLSKDIYLKVRRSNNIRMDVKDPARKAKNWEARSNLQVSAILDCNDMLYLIELARALFHLKGKKAEYWSNLTVETREYIKRWHESDVDRYKTSIR